MNTNYHSRFRTQVKLYNIVSRLDISVLSEAKETDNTLMSDSIFGPAKYITMEAETFLHDFLVILKPLLQNY